MLQPLWLKCQTVGVGRGWNVGRESVAPDMAPMKPGPTVCLLTEYDGEEAGRGKKMKGRGRSERRRKEERR